MKNKTSERYFHSSNSLTDILNNSKFLKEISKKIAVVSLWLSEGKLVQLPLKGV